MPKPRGGKGGKKKPKGSKKQRAELKATGGWGDTATAFEDEFEQPEEAPRWRLTQAIEDKNRRVQERRFIHQKKDKLAARLSKPLFPLPQPKKKVRKVKVRVQKEEDDGEDEEAIDGRRKVLCIRRKKPNSDSEDEGDSGDEDKRKAMFRKLVETSKTLVESEDEYEEEEEEGSDDNDEEKQEADEQNEMSPESSIHYNESLQQAFRHAYDEHFRATLELDNNSDTVKKFKPIEGTETLSFRSTITEQGELHKNNYLEICGIEGDMPFAEASVKSVREVVSELLPQSESTKNVVYQHPTAPILPRLTQASLSQFGDVLFAASLPRMALSEDKSSKSFSKKESLAFPSPLVGGVHDETMNHVAQLLLTSRSRVLEHDLKIKKKEKEEKEEEKDSKEALSSKKGAANTRKSAAATAVTADKIGGDEEDTNKANSTLRLLDEEENTNDMSSEGYRDQGFTRPRVLILAPTRNVAYHAIKLLKEQVGRSQTSGQSNQHVNVLDEDRFEAEFGPGDIDEETLASHKKKPDDWQQVFAGNMDDNFKLGLQITPARFAKAKGKNAVKGTEIRLFSEFYSSDVIIASSLGMVLTFNSNRDEEGDEDTAVDVDSDSEDDEEENDIENEDDDDDEKTSKSKKRSLKNKSKSKKIKKSKKNTSSQQDGVAAADFLSSIEIALVLNTDTMTMQNFDHLTRVFDLMNRRPIIERGSDYSRIRPWFLNDDPFFAARYRQTILFSNSMVPSVVGLFNRKCKSHSGKVRIRSISKEGAASTLSVAHRQIFQRVAHMAKSLKEADEERFKYLTSTLLPIIKQNEQDRTILFIPSYYDFIRIRNWLMENSYAFVAVHEYSRTSEVSRARSRFFRGQLPLMLYTGRAQYFFRYKMRGASHLIMYQLPEAGVGDESSLYSELVGFLDEAKTNGELTTCTTLFSKYDQLSLDRALGGKSSLKMLAQNKSTYLFS